MVGNYKFGWNMTGAKWFVSIVAEIFLLSQNPLWTKEVTTYSIVSMRY